MKKIKNNKGYIALMSVLIVGAVALSVAVYVLLSSANKNQINRMMEDSSQAQNISDTCGEMALLQIRLNDEFQGTGDMILGNGDCTYNVIDNGGESRTVEISSNYNKVTRRAIIQVDAIFPKINISSWKDVNEF